ncbi:protein AF-10 isoform X2 [Coccinella septempunctata]|uniref:protein AF-10 isoform X2 n=1 Tax=Coccinella septempunctata TaxID=41139 RepID=UPI001D06E93C|nr:protein AF-10 isoform X2 [Coccinella septempunctata]
MREMVGGCCVCSDDRGWSENPLVYCDGQSCTVAVHQACYGIVSVPTGPWYCRKCESQEKTSKKCELCPSRYGALKRTNNEKWAHVVCALYIPEVRFGNVTTMEPILLHLIPAERFNKVCYICEEKGKPSTAAIGACMSCNRIGCKQQFHVTCGQSLGLLCEEAGSFLDNVKYCGYCQYHYSKLKKGGNVKPIPPYKPVSDNHLTDSGSEKEAETAPSTSSKPVSSSTSTTNSTNSSSKRKSTSSSKTSNSSKTSGSNSKSSSSPSNSKTSHHNSKSSDKSKVSSSSSRSAKNTDNHTEHSSDSKTDKKDSKSENNEESKTSELKESKGTKKRKSNSRTPTPVTSVVSSDVTVVNSNATVSNSESSVVNSSEKKDTVISSGETVDKAKKLKVETTQSIISNQPVVALTSISTIKAVPPPCTSASEPPIVPPETTTVVSSTAQSIIQSTAPQSQAGSLAVSLPLSSKTLSPVSEASGSAQSISTLPNITAPQQDKSNDATKPQAAGGDLSSNLDSLNLEEENAQSSMLTSETSTGGLKITYEKQEAMSTNTTEEDMELEETQAEVPAKRTRSQSNDKTEKSVTNRGKKRSSGGGLGGNSNSSHINNNSNSNISMGNRRSSRSQMNVSPIPSQSSTQSHQLGAFSSITQNQLKNSPPSSPSSESQGAPPSTSKNKSKGRKSAPAVFTPSSSRDNKDVKLFQNGVTAPHMLGNQLNPNSNMAQKMSDHLNSELEAHSIFNPNENANMVGPQLHHKVVASARSNSVGSSNSGNGGLSGMLGGGSGNIPQTLDQLLERQWEQGSQFLMEQAQHFDIASLLSCLHQLRAENLRLEEHVSSLLQRRDHLLAVNARLAIPLTGQPATPQTTHPHTVNNIHPAVAAGHSDIPRSRHSAGSASYPAHPQGSSADVPLENGLPPDTNQTYTSHRSPVTGQPQRSPTVRLSPAGSSFSSNSLIRQNSDTSGRSAPRPQQYSHYQGTSQSQQQMVIRRDNEHHPSSKPS